MTGLAIDPVTDKTLRPELRLYVGREAISACYRSRAADMAFFVDDRIGFAGEVRSFYRRHGPRHSVSDALTYDAALQNPALIGEAATHIAGAVREIATRNLLANSREPRNRIAPGHPGVDNDIIWNIVQNDILALLFALRRITEGMESVGQDETPL